MHNVFVPYILGWPKIRSGFSIRCYGKSRTNFWPQPNIIYIIYGFAPRHPPQNSLAQNF